MGPQQERARLPHLDRGLLASTVMANLSRWVRWPGGRLQGLGPPKSLSSGLTLGVGVSPRQSHDTPLSDGQRPPQIQTRLCLANTGFKVKAGSDKGLYGC